MNLENLVCLVKSGDHTVKVTNLSAYSYRQHLEIDTETGTWRIELTAPWMTAHDARNRGPFRIGASIRTSDNWYYPYDLIGVYDRTITGHLSSLARESYNFGRGPIGWDDE